MGYRPREPKERAAGACLPGRNAHQGVPVTTLLGETVAHVCRYCLLKVRGVTPSADVAPMWMPCTDDGRPLPMLPATRRS